MSDTSLLQGHLTLAMKAVAHIIRRMQDDPRLAYLIGPGSETFDLLTAAAAAHEGFDKVEVRSFFTSLKTQMLPPIGLDYVDADIAFDLVAHLRRQREFSERTFGPGQRLQGVVDHIRKELIEVEKSGCDLFEWVDVVLLALDGAWRSGNWPEQIARAIAVKQAKNEVRTWPDWRTSDKDKAIEHVRAEAKIGGAA